MSEPVQQQTDIFADDLQQRHFAELCNALYERELRALAQQKSNNISLLQRRLGGLSHHIRRLAEHLLSNSAPIEVDVHNGSWRAKQAAKSMLAKADDEKTALWFAKRARPGLVVPVYLNDRGIEHLELDSIDRIGQENNRLHLNKHGWFGFEGLRVNDGEASPHLSLRILIPTKATMSAACCGHSWNHRGRTQPRALTLRELLLSTTINWRTFA